MAAYRFLHAADLHLDSPLLGLRSKSETWALRVERASRQAFEGLIALAQSQKCRFVVLAGDVFDGALRNYQTGLFFMAGMRTLSEAGIEVFVILGNHDAENQFAKQLPLARNVRMFAADAPETFVIEDLKVCVHGQSFAARDITENLARAYPAPMPGHFNIGVLHTACQGSADHAPYAPCSIEQLVHHGYNYWALGHVHTRAILHKHPHIVYPGNLQGRSPKETGSKGVSIVHVDDGRVTDVVHHPLDVVRWAQISVDVTGTDSTHEVIECIRASLHDVQAIARDKPVALRISLLGHTKTHTALQLFIDDMRQKVQTLLELDSGNLWLERLRLSTQPPKALDGPQDPTVTGELGRLVQKAMSDGSAQALVLQKLDELRDKWPAGADAEQRLARLKQRCAASAVALAQALLDDKASVDAPV